MCCFAMFQKMHFEIKIVMNFQSIAACCSINKYLSFSYPTRVISCPAFMPYIDYLLYFFIIIIDDDFMGSLFGLIQYQKVNINLCLRTEVISINLCKWKLFWFHVIHVIAYCISHLIMPDILNWNIQVTCSCAKFSKKKNVFFFSFQKN